MNFFDKFRKKQMNCILGGCDAEIKNCARCGFQNAEAKRRKHLPLVRCADGLQRKIVGGDRA